MIQKISDYKVHFEDWLHRQPDNSFSLPLKALHRLLRVLFAVIRDLIRGDISLHAMSLVYTTILSIVPMLALSFSVLKAFNVQDRFTPMLYGFFEPMGEKGLEIHNSVLSFVENIKVGVLGMLGFLLLFYTVISLVQKIERAFNIIWYAPTLRSVGQRFTNYLSVVLVGPVVVVGAIGVTASTLNSGVVQSLAAIEPFGTIIIWFTKLMPFLMIIAAFTFFYVLMPNTKVNLRSALVGGVVSGVSWQATSLLFASFVVGSAKYDAIYSGFAVGIILLIWLYVNWLILLLGSSIAFYHQNDNHITRSPSVDLSPELNEGLALDIMVKVAEEYESQNAPVLLKEIEGSYSVPAVLTRRVVERLLEEGLLLIAGDKSDRLAPGHSTDLITVSDILKSIRKDAYSLLDLDDLDPRVNELVAGVTEIHTQNTTTLRDLIDSNKK